MFKKFTGYLQKAVNSLSDIDKARDGLNAMTAAQHLAGLKGGATQGYKNFFKYIGKDMDGAVGTGEDFIKAYGKNKQAVYNAMSKTESGRAFLAQNNIQNFEGFTDEAMANFGKADVKLGTMDMMRLSHTNADGTYSASKIATSAAGAYITGAAAYRIGSGGGLYKDSDGNTNIIGIPGI